MFDTVLKVQTCRGNRGRKSYRVVESLGESGTPIPVGRDFDWPCEAERALQVRLAERAEAQTQHAAA